MTGVVAIEGGRIRAGRWEAEIVAEDAAGAPAIEVLHLDRTLDCVTVGDATDSGRWPVSVAIPAELLSDGVQTFVVRNAETQDTLAHFTIIAGEPLDDDLRAEIDLLRAELDLLKKAFRRHCVTSGGS